MFTGLIQTIGRFRSVCTIDMSDRLSGVRVVVDAPVVLWANVQLGESIAINGACMTVVEFDDSSFTVDVSHESLQCTAPWIEGAFVNIERALRVGDSVGGHWVSGHVDGVGVINALTINAESYLLRIRLSAELATCVIQKGSITVHGVSLTINQVEKTQPYTLVSINLIPHTWQNTIFQYLSVGDAVNIEIDLMAKQVHHYVKHYKELGNEI